MSLQMTLGNMAQKTTKKMRVFFSLEKLMQLKLILNGCLSEKINQNLRYGENLRLVIYFNY